MAKYILNSTSSKALLKSEIIAFEKQPYEKAIDGDQVESGWQLLVKMSRGFDPDVVFEQAPTEAEIDALGATFLNALES